MKYDPDHSTDEWLDRLDAIVAGKHPLSTDDDELLHVASRLSQALAPLRELDAVDAIRRQRLLSRLHNRQTTLTHEPVQRVSGISLLIASLLLSVLIIGMLNTGGLAAMWSNVAQIWHASTSLDQLQGVSVASLARPHAGLKPLPLLPSVLPNDTQATNYGVITDSTNPDLLTTFVADYHIAGQEVLLYEQPSYGPFASSTAQNVSIGPIAGQLFQDESGNNALQWYQYGMECQITSKMPVERLVALASTFQPLKSWELLR